MGMDVDPSGGDQQAAGVDRASRRTQVASYAADAIGGDGDVAGEARLAGSVDDSSTLD